MDKLARSAKIPIRNRTLKKPVFVVLNIPTCHYKAFGGALYEPLLSSFRIQPKVSQSQIHFVPNIVSANFTIEERAEQMARRVKRQSERIGVDKVHVVTHSFGGVDARAALRLYGMDEHVQSLTTLSTPHHGLRLIDMIKRYPSRYQI